MRNSGNYLVILTVAVLAALSAGCSTHMISNNRPAFRLDRSIDEKGMTITLTVIDPRPLKFAERAQLISAWRDEARRRCSSVDPLEPIESVVHYPYGEPPRVDRSYIISVNNFIACVPSDG